MKWAALLAPVFDLLARIGGFLAAAFWAWQKVETEKSKTREKEAVRQNEILKKQAEIAAAPDGTIDDTLGFLRGRKGPANER